MAGEKNSGVDLSGLDALGGFGDMSFGSLIDGGGAAGQPLLLKLDDIEEDPDQPRIEFSEEKMAEMRESIRANMKKGRKPIKTPISVKKHPTQPGKWLLNDGARRYRCAKLEGVVEIPAFEDDEHDDYDQMVVNIQREGHTPLEIALFIQKREAKGDKKGEIAKRLGKSASFVSKHAALTDMPPSVRQAYDAGRCREVEALYLLVKNFEEFPDQIDALCLAEGTDVISKYTVAELLDSLKNPAPAYPAPGAGASGGPAPVNAGFDNPNAGGGSGGEGGTSESGHTGQQHDDGGHTEPGNEGPGGSGQQQADDDGLHTEEGGKGEGKGSKQADPDKIRKPIVQIEHDERPARLQLDRRAANGLAWIKYDDDGHEVEIDIGAAKLIAIVEGA